MRATVAELQGDAREGGAERSSRQTCGRRNTNSQRGRMRAVSVRGNAKPRGHQDADGRGWRHAGKVHVLTQGDLVCESRQGVSRGHSGLTEPGAREGSANCHRNTLAGEGPKEPESQALESIGQGRRSKRVRRQPGGLQGAGILERTRCGPCGEAATSQPGTEQDPSLHEL